MSGRLNPCFLILAVTWIPIGALAASEHDPHFSYDGDTGPSHWASLSPKWTLASHGRMQSPVDIDDVEGEPLPGLAVRYDSTPVNILNNGHTIEVLYEPGSYLRADGTRHELKQLHFHAPSEHTVDGKHAAMEMHLVHQDEGGHLAVVAILIDQGEENAAFASVFDNLPPHKALPHVIDGAVVDAAAMLPRSRAYYRYDGSLTTPPCSEGVKWFVLKAHVELSRRQIESFRQIIGHNNRPTQPLNSRVVIGSP